MTTLTAFDRCDRCNAQAKYRTWRKGRDLLFCGHHYSKHELALLAAGFSTDSTDESAVLAEMEAQS